MISTRKKALWITVAMVTGALEPMMAKYAYRYGVQPFPLFFVRNVVAALVLIPFLMQGAKLNGKNIGEIVPVSLLLMLTGFCTLIALSCMPAVTVITVVTTTPAIVALINQKLGRDRLAKYFWLGFFLCFFGVILSLDLSLFSSNLQGLVAVLVAVVSSSIYRVRMEQLTERFSPAWASAVCFLLIGSLSSLIFAMNGSQNYLLALPPVETLPWCIAIGLAAAAANVSFVTALNQVGSTRISIITMLQRPLLIIATAVFLQEQMTPMQIVGIIMVIIGMNYARVERVSEIREDVKIPVAQTGL